MNYLIVFIGSGIGGALRHGMGTLTLRWLGPAFPWGTLAVNVIGSALIGIAVAVLLRHPVAGTELRLFLVTGIIGGFTTFSAFSLDTLTLWQRGRALLAAAYVIASVVLSIAALAGTLVVARRLM